MFSAVRHHFQGFTRRRNVRGRIQELSAAMERKASLARDLLRSSEMINYPHELPQPLELRRSRLSNKHVRDLPDVVRMDMLEIELETTICLVVLKKL